MTMPQPSTLVFDTHAAIHELTKSGMPEQQAECVVRLQTNLLESNLATKVDIEGLKKNIEELRQETTTEIAALRKDTTTKIAALSKDTTTEIAALRKDTTTKIAALSKDTTTEIAALRKDTTTEIAALSKDTTTEIAALRKDTTTEIAALRKDTRIEIAAVEARLVKWMIGVNFSSIAILTGIIALLITTL